VSQLRISLLQADLTWENPAANRLHFDQLLSDTPPSDLIVLPEMFTTGFSMRPEAVAEPYGPDSPTLVWMQNHAAETGAVLCGSVCMSTPDGYHNRLLWVRPDGSHGVYDKRHLFTFGGEDQHYSPGSARPIFEVKGFRVLPLICYDLRFPVWSRNRLTGPRADYDLLLYVANWPAVRSDPWQKLLFARAIENVSYVAAVNRVGWDGNGIEHSGDSVILDFRGTPLTDSLVSREGILTATIDLQELNAFREKFPALRDGDRFKLLG
jgi:omega-amidase